MTNKNNLNANDKELYFFKTYANKWEQLSPEYCNPKSRIIIYDATRNFVLCPYHCRWESVTQIAKNSVTCAKGKKTEGIVVNFPKDFKSQKNTFVEFDEDKDISPAIVYYYVFISTERNLYTINVTSIDYDKLSSFKPGSIAVSNVPTITQQYTYNIKSHKVETFLQAEGPGTQNSIPHIIKNEIENVAKLIVEEKTGRNIRINSNYYKGLSLIEAVDTYPYESNIYALKNVWFAFSEDMLASETNVSKILDKDDPNIYNTLCEKLNIKSFKTLRKLFEKNPRVLFEYKMLLYLGFTDTNVISEILSNKKNNFFSIFRNTSFRVEDDSTSPAYLYTYYKISSFKFFTSIAIPLRGEKATWKMLIKQPYMEVSLRADLASMFCRFYENIPATTQKRILTEGFTVRNHDILSTDLSLNKEDLVIFNYTPEEYSLQDKISRYTFGLPTNSEELRRLGSMMHNCVGSYTSRIQKKHCTIVYAMNDEGEYVLCIEVRRMRDVHQARMDYNKNPKGEIRSVFNQWCRDHKLIFTVNRF